MLIAREQPALRYHIDMHTQQLRQLIDQVHLVKERAPGLKADEQVNI